jgi:hypothetical protein
VVMGQRVRMEAEERVQASGSRDSEYELVALTRTTQQEHQSYIKRLLFLQQSRKLIEQQLPRLLGTVAAGKFEDHFKRAREQVEGNLLGMGLPAAITGFFHGMKQDLTLFSEEVAVTQQLIGKLYARHSQETGSAAPPVPRMDASAYLRDIADLEAQAAPYKNRFGNLLGGQNKAFDRFFDTLAREAGNVSDRARSDAERWCKQSLAPLMQQTLAYKKRLELQLAKLERLRSFGDNRTGGSESLQDQSESLRAQQTLLEDILGRLKDRSLH